MTSEEFQAEVARLALVVAQRHGFEHDLVECEVSRGDQVVRLQLVRFDRHRLPVMMQIGPVLHLDDVLGTKVAALATRAAPRDYIDTAAALARYSRDRLIELARQADSGLTAAQVDEVRHCFSTWPRSATWRPLSDSPM
ncbi:hypothetical protein [Micromonospora sp. NBC_01813]|uniref:hypothetical protein n=1 Tax=Micromonospora sp. NBC_01813 TaxID=2975988 RepID=UPI002DD9062A|nr:hypothetical protein [Micromonospora sp. NBC_01813]WSA10499.1 hypothetical protein OG958_06845 [Micromonospora sp. NBC_01813]